MAAGEATSIGRSTQFGIRENDPQGLAHHNDILYMVGGKNEALYELNKTTGNAEQIGSATKFGTEESPINESDPRGLVHDGANLYMLGALNRALYKINTSDGTADKITDPDVSLFGVGENMPRGLAHHNNILYMVGATNNALYMIDKNSGAATKVVVKQFSMSESDPQGLASDGTNLYMVGSASGTNNPPNEQRLFTLNKDTGVADKIHNTNQIGLSETEPRGLAFVETTLYMVGATNNYLYTLDTLGENAGIASKRGVISSVAAASNDILIATQAISGKHESQKGNIFQYLEEKWINRGDLTDLSNIITIGTITATGSAVSGFGSANDITIFTSDISDGFSSQDGNQDIIKGDIWISNGSTAWIKAGNLIADYSEISALETITSGTQFPEESPRGIASLHGILYMVGSTNKALYILNTSDGTASRVGDSNSFGIELESNKEINPQGLAALSNKLYMVCSGTKALYEVDISDGSATKIGSAEEFGVGEKSPRGLTALGDQLYMLGSDENKSLYKLNHTTGIATKILVEEFGVGEDDPQGLASIGTGNNAILYMTGEKTKALYILNTTTGVAKDVRSNNIIIATDEISEQSNSEKGDVFQHTGSAWVKRNTLTDFSDISTIATVSVAGDEPSVGTANNVHIFSEQKGAESTRRTTGETTIANAEKGDVYLDDATNWNYIGNLTALSDVSSLGAISGETTLTNKFGAVEESKPRGLASDGTNLYMVGAENDRLYALNVSTGIAEEIGTRMGFPASVDGMSQEKYPRGLVSDGTNLYMVGGEKAALYSLSTSTGVATRVPERNPPVKFGSVAESDPRGLAMKGTTEIWMVGAEKSTLYTLDISSGEATKVGNDHEFGENAENKIESNPSGIAEIKRGSMNTLYMTGGGGGVLYELTQLGIVNRTSDHKNFGVGESDPRGLASNGTILYMVGAKTNALYSVETIGTDFGKATRIGNAEAFGIEETSPQGLAYHNNNLYMVGTKNSSLYTLDITEVSASTINLKFEISSEIKTDDFKIKAIFDLGSGTITEFTPDDIAITRNSNGANPETAKISRDYIKITSLSKNSFDLNFFPTKNVFGTYTIGKTDNAKVKIDGIEKIIGNITGNTQFTINTT